MIMQVSPSQLQGKIAVPGSKSHTIRGIVAALQTAGMSILRAPLISGDTRSVLTAAKLLGAKVCEYPDRWEISGIAGNLRPSSEIINMNNSGTGLRLLTALAATGNSPVSFDGDNSLRSRPMLSLLEALKTLGACVKSDSGKCPLTVCGPLHGGKVTLEGKSSQFLTALLFALPCVNGDSEINLPFLYEQPYVLMTVEWLKSLGVEVEYSSDLLHWKIPGNQKFRTFDRIIPADFSTAGFPLAAGIIAGGGRGIEITNLDFKDAQGDKMVFELVKKMGANLKYENNKVLVTHSPKLYGAVLDLNATPDALPLFAVLGTFAKGETRLINVAQARLKETDRIKVMHDELLKMGAEITELPDGMIIRGGKLHGAAVNSHEDHRVAMALSIAGFAATGVTEIMDAESISVSYPDFITDFQALGGNITYQS